MIQPPKWLLVQEGMAARQWRAKKRAELKAVIAAWRAYAPGSAWCPGYSTDHRQIDTALESLKKSHSQKAWGR